MDSDKIKRMNTQISNILKYLMVIFVIAFIAWLFPSNLHTQYKYNLGDRWRYDNHVSPFDFSIKKSGEEIQNEQNEVLKDIYPFYLFDEKVVAEQTKNLKRDCSKNLRRFRK